MENQPKFRIPVESYFYGLWDAFKLLWPLFALLFIGWIIKLQIDRKSPKRKG